MMRSLLASLGVRKWKNEAKKAITFSNVVCGLLMQLDFHCFNSVRTVDFCQLDFHRLCFNSLHFDEQSMHSATNVVHNGLFFVAPVPICKSL